MVARRLQDTVEGARVVLMAALSAYRRATVAGTSPGSCCGGPWAAADALVSKLAQALVEGQLPSAKGTEKAKYIPVWDEIGCIQRLPRDWRDGVATREVLLYGPPLVAAESHG